MYLKRLELYGFKTFAARTTLDFERGVTGVVGPNGSGKSNLADAVRWALGEQNVRNVRCRQADDLIFAGAVGQGTRAGARPAMNMAEVLLTFDNSSGWLPVDFHEVRIGRRLYRGGDNEYLLNGARVRLRDVADLLARAAINAGGHLVIGQGLIDTVLSQRPEERRALVETLAGLRFYYSRRDDAEAKLRAVEANIKQVDAMIAEASPHLATLREQAAAYRQYDEVERELRALLLLHYAQAQMQAGERRARLTLEQTAAQAALETARAAVRGAEADLTSARERARRCAGEAGALRAEVRAAHEAREASERELAVSAARRESAVARVAELRAGLPALEARRAELARELAHADEGARAIERERAALHEGRGPVERALDAATAEVAAAERGSRALAERRRGLEVQEATAKAELAALDREDAAAGDEARRLAGDEQATAKGVHGADAALAAARVALDAATLRVEECRAAESQARLQAGAAAESARASAAHQREAEHAAAGLRAQVSGLRAWLEAMGGANGADSGPANDTAFGAVTVAEALVTDEATAPALAAALGPMLSARGVPSTLPAHEAAALLDGGARGLLTGGRAALDGAAHAAIERTIAGAGVAPELVLGWGDSLARVEAAGEIAVALRGALSTVLAVSDVAAAWQVHAALAQGDGDGRDVVVLATPAGEALLPSGLLYRPAGEGAAALERARELRAAEHALRGAEEELSAAETVARRVADAGARHTAAAESAQRALRAADSERGARRNEVAAAERAATQARREAAWATERSARASEAAAARLKRRTDCEGRLAELRGALDALAREESPVPARLAAARAALQAATRHRAEHGAALALASERAADAARRRKGAEEALTRLDGDMQARRAALAQLDEEARAVAGDEKALAERLAGTAQKLRGLHERLRPLESELTALESRTVGLETRLAALRPEEARAAAAHEAAALALQRAEHEVESVAAALRADLALEPIDLPAPGPPNPALPGRIKTLRARLSAFGPVNARAPEDLAAALERQEFLQMQSADLRDGMARLRAVIAEANATVRERYGSVAGELDAQFRLYVQRLFDGGRGELTALYDETGLPSGLEIAVQPPGKRTRELALLSGGERALVGLCLIFAMLAVRPVPFCVLDEAEAALDEANTLRVGEILRALSARTQMIVITHNRGTMSHADALYGVTMAETGLSQVAGLRLEDLEAARRDRTSASRAG